MDDLARYNRARWEELAQANILYSRPWLDMDAAEARKRVDLHGMVGDLAGKAVLCLAGGGGQQSAAFALLGAEVTVLDLSPTQLERDRQAAAHYGTAVRTIGGDMRDLSCFAPGQFDLVWHAHSLNFVPDARQVFGEVARVLRPGGRYCLHCHNPCYHVPAEGTWTGQGYLMSSPYVDGAEVVSPDPRWDVEDETGQVRKITGPREFRHSLSTLVNGLIERRMTILGCWEDTDSVTLPDAAARPGSWAHYQAICPPWLLFWARREKA